MKAPSRSITVGEALVSRKLSRPAYEALSKWAGRNQLRLLMSVKAAAKKIEAEKKARRDWAKMQAWKVAAIGFAYQPSTRSVLPGVAEECTGIKPPMSPQECHLTVHAILKQMGYGPPAINEPERPERTHIIRFRWHSSPPVNEPEELKAGRLAFFDRLVEAILQGGESF